MAGVSQALGEVGEVAGAGRVHCTVVHSVWVLHVCLPRKWFIGKVNIIRS